MEGFRFEGLPRAVLVAVSKLSGETYRDVEWDELREELRGMGYEPDEIGLMNLMRQLKDDGFIDGYLRSGGMDLITLGSRGREEVQGWPSPFAGPNVEALIRLLEARSEDERVPEPERGKARAAAAAVRDLGVQVTGEILTAWLRSQGVGN